MEKQIFQKSCVLFAITLALAGIALADGGDSGGRPQDGLNDKGKTTINAMGGDGIGPKRAEEHGSDYLGDRSAKELDG
ncbi:MAG: hypothetical protein AAB116_12870, partial [Candidatus Poribacteria bacterium]